MKTLILYTINACVSVLLLLGGGVKEKGTKGIRWWETGQRPKS